MKRSPTIEDRFWAKVDRSGGATACWPWTAAKTPDNYGQFQARGVWAGSAHRLAYMLTVGEIPAGLHLDHLCHTNDPSCDKGSDCPHRLCVNPAHLEPVTPRENAARVRGNFGEINRAKTACPAGHPYNAENTFWVQDRATPHRRCRTCARARKRKSAA
jgi:hypothetical protein